MRRLRGCSEAFSLKTDLTKGVDSMRHEDKMRTKRRRRRKLFWLFAAAAVCALLFTEQVAVLYVLSTLAVCGLMTVVAFSNLEARDVEMQTAAIREAADVRRKSSGDLSTSKRRAA
jgi:Flp pilus assembly protein TadB